MESPANPTNDTTPDVQESKRRLILFAGLADETLTRVREIARRLEQRMRTLLRTDAPSPLHKPHFHDGDKKEELSQ
jgi:hypothetical protein